MPTWKRRPNQQPLVASPTLTQPKPHVNPPTIETPPNRRILIVDDNVTIHKDFEKILTAKVTELELSVTSLEDTLFGESAGSKASDKSNFELESAYQGEDGVEQLRAALAEGRPHAMAFVDVRMPPGIDGIETIERLWAVDASLQIVLCTAYSDYSWEEMFGRLGHSDNLVILKKPFDATEVLQLAHALTEKWRLSRAARLQLGQLESLVDARTAELRAEIEVRHRAEAEARHAKFLAEQASRAKSAFLANMSHEIRTPMNGVLGMCQLLLDSNLSVEQRDLAETLAASSEALLSLLNDVLDISKIEAERLVLENVPFSLEELVESAIQLFGSKASEKALDLVAEVQSECAGLFVGDSARIRQILLNLLSNAIKFTTRGEVSLLVRRLGLETGGERLEFVIRDTGIGISPEDLPHLFAAFIQADSSITRRFGGTGLGLAICKRLIELMGGTIHVASTPNLGSTFTVQLVLPRSTDASLPPTVPTEIPNLGGRRALVVDDCATNRKLVRHLLEAWQGTVEEASSAAGALELMDDQTPTGRSYDLVFLDFQMPEMDGISLAVEIVRRSGRKAPPMVLLTSQADRPDREQLENAGIRACLFKPLRKLQFAECLAGILGARPQERTPVMQPPPSPAMTHRTLPITKPFRVLVAEDNQVNQKVALLHLQKLGFQVDLAKDGREAIEAVRQQQYDLVFMDCQMPELDGLAATRFIRTVEQGTARRLPIIAMTAGTVLGVREECLAAGMDDYIAKPVRWMDLLAIVQRHLAMKGGQPATDAPPLRVSSTVVAPSRVAPADEATPTIRPVLPAQEILPSRESP